MIKVSSDADRIVVAKVQDGGQGQVFDHWDRLSPGEQKTLLKQLQSLDHSSIRTLILSYQRGGEKKLRERVHQPFQLAEPPADACPSSLVDEVRKAGEEILREGQVAVLMAAGGLCDQESPDSPGALGGTIPVGPVSGKTLYRLHAEKIRALNRRFRTTIPFLVITSPQTHDQTLAAFQENEFFGLGRLDVKFLMQDCLPVIDRRGHYLLEEPGRLAMSPNGHGGALLQVLRDDIFSGLEARGIQHLFYFQADNPLTRIADPEFIGHHALGGYEVTGKAIRKDDPDEKLGMFCQCNGALAILEYCEMAPEDMVRRLESGRLAYSAGNSGIHAFSMDFLRRIREEKLSFPYHFVEAKTSYIDRGGRRMTPKKPNSIRFEMFIFDTLAWARKSLVLETDREQEFSPIKALRGEKSPEAARRALSRLYSRWLREAGASFPEPAGSNGAGAGQEPAVEISPLFALDADELRGKLELPFEVTPDLYLQ